jgi:hypothetical protein
MIPLFARWTEWAIITLFLLGCVILAGGVLALDRLAGLVEYCRRQEDAPRPIRHQRRNHATH